MQSQQQQQRYSEYIPVQEYAPPNNFIDTLAQIPVLNWIVPYLIVPILFCVVQICEWILARWRTENQAVSEFLALRPRQKPGMFHLHVFIRKSIEGPEDSAFCIGLNIGDRRVMFVIPTNTSATASELLPQIVKEICQSTIRANQDDPYLGKPSWITTPDYVLYLEFVKRFQQHSITMLRKADSQIMLGRPDSDEDPVPLSAVTDSIATTMDRNAGLILMGEDLPSTVEESFRPSKTRPGTSRSTVKREHEVPPSIEFCGGCGQLFLRKDLMECQRCLFPAYCSQSCQKVDWKDHRHVCKHLMLVKEQGGFLE